MTAITAWSYSRWDTWRTCPLKARLKFVDHLPEPPSPAMERGKRLHEAAAGFLTARRVAEAPPALPPAELASVADGLMELRRLGARAEVELCFDKGWRPIEWFSRAAWFRAKLDALAPGEPALVVDFKTGRRRDEHEDQLSLYALAVMMKADAVVVDCAMWYVDEGGARLERRFERGGLSGLRETWEGRAAKFLGDREFGATPGPHCRWCPWRRGAGGPCEEG